MAPPGGSCSGGNRIRGYQAQHIALLYAEPGMDLCLLMRHTLHVWRQAAAELARVLRPANTHSHNL